MDVPEISFYKSLAFSLYDMNSDGSICELDLFSVVKHSSDDLFINVIQQDLKDIQSRLSHKKQFNSLFSGSSFQQTVSLQSQFKIENLSGFLEERKKINDLNSNFLSVFTSPKAAAARPLKNNHQHKKKEQQEQSLF